MLGYSHESFWEQTARTVQLTFDAGAERLGREHNDRAWMAWHVAALQRSKKFPQLSKLLVQRRKQDNWRKQVEGLKNWVIATGGKVIVK